MEIEEDEDEGKFLEKVKEYMGVDGSFFEPAFMASDNDGFIPLKNYPNLEVRIFGRAPKGAAGQSLMVVRDLSLGLPLTFCGGWRVRFDGGG